MNEKLKQRFIDAYQKLYGVIPSLIWDGTYYRSPHLPMALNAKRFLGHIIKLELRTA